MPLQIIDSGAAGPRPRLPAVSTPRRESHGRGRRRRPPRSLLLPSTRSPRYRSHLTAPHGAYWDSYITTSVQSWRHASCTCKNWTPLTTLMNCSSLIPFGDCCMPTGSESTRLRRCDMPTCATPPSTGRRPSHPTYCRVTLRTSVPSFRTPRIWKI